VDVERANVHNGLRLLFDVVVEIVENGLVDLGALVVLLLSFIIREDQEQLSILLADQVDIHILNGQPAELLEDVRRHVELVHVEVERVLREILQRMDLPHLDTLLVGELPPRRVQQDVLVVFCSHGVGVAPLDGVVVLAGDIEDHFV